jgi:SAM-dependent methyltransferase
MSRTNQAQDLFREAPLDSDGVIVLERDSQMENQSHTNAAFSEKWQKLEKESPQSDAYWQRFQLDWYLKLHGYQDEADLQAALLRCSLVLDAGCGLGYKAAWFARLSPDTTVIAMDFSDSEFLAKHRYAHLKNLIFVKGDIAATKLRSGIVDLVSCDQVLQHTESPPDTLREFHRITSATGTLNTYVYAKKALPRELLDDHFREASKGMSHEALWEMSQQLTHLGRLLSELHLEIDFPAIPALGIQGGKQDLQRFLYWNFIKCFWNEDMGEEASISTNFDWYSPSNAYRYSRQEFLSMCEEAGWTNSFLHSQQACWSGRFHKAVT